MSDLSKGVLAVLGSAVIWGLSPLFYKALSHVPALDVLAHRMIWSLVFFAVILAAQGRLQGVVKGLLGKVVHHCADERFI